MKIRSTEPDVRDEERVVLSLDHPTVRTVRRRLLSQAVLFSNPDAYRAGVEDTLAALGDSTYEERPVDAPTVRMI